MRLSAALVAPLALATLTACNGPVLLEPADVAADFNPGGGDAGGRGDAGYPPT